MMDSVQSHRQPVPWATARLLTKPSIRPLMRQKSRMKTNSKLVLKSAGVRQRSSWPASKTNSEAVTSFGRDRRSWKFRKRLAWARPKYTNGGGTRLASEWRNWKRPARCLNLVLICLAVAQILRRSAEIQKTILTNMLIRMVRLNSTTSLIRPKKLRIKIKKLQIKFLISTQIVIPKSNSVWSAKRHLSSSRIARASSCPLSTSSADIRVVSGSLKS